MENTADVLNVRIIDHAIIFGLSQSDEDRQLLAESWTNCPEWFFTSRKAHAVGTVTPDSIRYVAGYCQKKLTGNAAKQEYGDKQPPFQLSSQRLGLKYFEKILPTVERDKGIFEAGKQLPVPKYFTQKFDLDFQNEKTWRQHQLSVIEAYQGNIDNKIKNLRKLKNVRLKEEELIDMLYLRAVEKQLAQQGYNLKIKEEKHL